MNAMIVGHSVCARLQSDLIAGSDPQIEYSFKLAGKVDTIEFLGRGGKCTECVEKEDLKQICDEGPNIVVLMIGENDIFLDADPEGFAGRAASLTTMMCNKGYTEEVVICKLLPRLCAPRCILYKMNGRKKDRISQYLESYSQQVSVINQELEAATKKLGQVTFWDHNGKFDAKHCRIQEKIGRDGIHLSAGSQYQLYKSL